VTRGEFVVRFYDLMAEAFYGGLSLADCTIALAEAIAQARRDFGENPGSPEKPP